MLPELLGRLPVRVDLNMLTKKEFKLILTKVKYNLLEQYKKLLGTDDINIEFQESAIDRIAGIAEEINFSMENFGARRLFSLVEKTLEELSFETEGDPKKIIKIDDVYVDKMLEEINRKSDYNKHLI